MLTFKPGDNDRLGRGTAWRYWSRRCGRQVHFPTGATFHYSLGMEFDPTVARFIEQPELEGDAGKRIGWPHHLIWLYVERITGRRELHCSEDLLEASDPKVREMADRLKESGLRFVLAEGNSVSEKRLRNLIRLLGLVGQSEPAVPVCAEQLKAAAKPGGEIQMAELFAMAAKKGSSDHIAARAIALLLHEGTLTADLERELLSRDLICTWT